MVGKTLGHYRAGEQLGRGGMGEVYVADDISLGRKVALKFLPEAFTGDPERVARFEREAKLLASLNHPNIAAIYGLEQAEGKRFIVMELVKGETLARRLSKGALPLDEALGICRQIAEGLEAAHEKGVIHRDLKPANVMITEGDKVRILDFGLAKALSDETLAVDASRSPTITEAMTQPGIVLGTAAYMSPEQAKGKSVDKRADIWAFGCILYECLTGKRAFEGETVTETLAAVLKGEPDFQMLPVGTPGGIRNLLHRCLQKKAADRLHDIADARIEVSEPATQTPEAALVLRKVSLARLVLLAAIFLLVGIFIGLQLTKYFHPVPAKEMVTSLIRIEPGFQRPIRQGVTISTDGRFIIYSATDAFSKNRLYLRKMGRSEIIPIAGTEGGVAPFLSPDNLWIGFWADRKLKKIPVEGGVATTLFDSPNMLGASWGPDNTIIFANTPEQGFGRTGQGLSGSGLLKISADGGAFETLTKLDLANEEFSHRSPSYLPNGNAVLFTIMRFDADPRPRLALLRMDTRKYRILFEDASDGRYTSTGHLLFMRQGTLMAVRFDPIRMETVGQPVAVVKEVMQILGSVNNSTACGQFSVSESGTLVYANAGFDQERKNSLVWVDQRGVEQPAAATQFAFQFPRLSPDAQKIAYIAYGRERQVWVYDLIKGTNSRLTSEGRATFPIWSPVGKKLLFMWHRALSGNLYWQSYDGSSPMERLTNSSYFQMPSSWSVDGKTVFLVEIHPETGSDIYVFDVASKSVKPFLNSPFEETYPDLSPDGHWLAFSSDESKQDEVYVRPFPSSNLKYQISNGGGTHPLWAKDGKQIFYRWRDQVWAVDVNKTDRGLATSKPRLLFEKPGYLGSTEVRGWDISADGKRFLMVKREENRITSVNELTLIQNWFEELKRLVPLGKQ
jgi:eukaryotic-like serine/threonine-protein kinase